MHGKIMDYGIQRLYYNERDSDAEALGPDFECLPCLTSRFWVEKGAMKHWNNMSLFLAKPYGPGLKTRLC